MALDDILFLGDVHGQVTHVTRAMTQAAHVGIDTIIQVGDFWCYKDNDLAIIKRHQDSLKKLLGVTVVIHFIDGNHENYKLINPHGLIQKFGENLVYYHPRGDVFDIHGVTIGAFGGAVSVNQSQQYPGINWFSEEVPSPGDMERARQSFSQGLDVLITHEIPERAIAQVLSEDINTTIYDAHKVREMVDELLTISCASVVVHGHWHVPALGSYDGVTVVSLGKEDREGSTAVISDNGQVQSVVNRTLREFPQEKL